jgi:hypothetical protein
MQWQAQIWPPIERVALQIRLDLDRGIPLARNRTIAELLAWLYSLDRDSLKNNQR